MPNRPKRVRGQIHLPTVSVHDARSYVPPVNHERDVVIRLRAFAFGRAHQFAVVAQEDEQRVVRPRTFEGFRHEVPDGPVGIFHDLFFRRPAARMEVGRDDVRRMVADSEQDS